MANYIQEVEADSEAAVNAFIAIITPDDVAVCLRHLHVSTSDADKDDVVQVKVVRSSDVNSGGVDGSPKAVRNNAPTNACSTKIKDGGTAFAVGDDLETIRTWNVYGRAPLDEDLAIWSNPGENIEIHISRTDGADITTLVSAEWEE